MGVEARERDAAASRAAQALIEVVARRVAAERSGRLIVLALRVEGSKRRLSVRLEPGRNGRPIVFVGQPLRRGGARRGDETGALAVDCSRQVECVLPEVSRLEDSSTVVEGGRVEDLARVRLRVRARIKVRIRARVRIRVRARVRARARARACESRCVRSACVGSGQWW